MAVTITSASHNRPRARITSQGQITIPKAVREQLGVKAGDDVEFEAGPDGMFIRPRARRSVLDFAGIAADSVIALPRDPEAVKALIRELRDRDVAEKYALDADRKRGGG